MNLTQTTRRIHPLMAGAAVSVTLVSLLGVAALTGILPSSHALSADTAATAAAAHTHPVAAVRKNAPVYAQAQYPQQVSQPAPAPVARNSPVGIGLGAVIGGALGSQVGSGDGKTLATIAGAIGGGYIGNEVAKKNQ